MVTHTHIHTRTHTYIHTTTTITLAVRMRTVAAVCLRSMAQKCCKRYSDIVNKEIISACVYSMEVGVRLAMKSVKMT